MPVFSAKPLQFNKKWLEHSKQFLIVLFKVTNSLVYGYINMMIFHHDVQRLSYSVQSGVFPQTVGQDKMPDETFEPYRKIAVIDEEGKIESPGIPPQGNPGERLETGSQQIIEINIQQYPRIASEFWLKPMHHLANCRMMVGIVVNSGEAEYPWLYPADNSYRSFPLRHRLQNCPTVLFCSNRKGIYVPDSS